MLDDALWLLSKLMAAAWRVRIVVECRRLESARRKRPWVRIPHPPPYNRRLPYAPMKATQRRDGPS